MHQEKTTPPQDNNIIFSIDTVHIKASDVNKRGILASPRHAQCLLPATACRISRSTTAVSAADFVHNLHPWFWNSILYSLIFSWDNSAHFLQLMPFTVLHFSFHHVPIAAGWAKAVWKAKFAQHFHS